MTLFFKKKYSLVIKIQSNETFIIPEYKIDLLNKSKKIIKSFEKVDTIIEVDKTEKTKKKGGKVKSKEKIKNQEKMIKAKTKKKIRTLWVRRKKLN